MGTVTGRDLMKELWDTEPVQKRSKHPRNGRNNELHEQRNEHLAYRLYYYYKNFPQVKAEAINERVCREFNIQLRTLHLLKAELWKTLERLRKDNPSNEELAEKYNLLHRWDGIF